MSYSRRDHALALDLKHRIEELGYSVWLDTEDISGGHLWRTQIVEGIENCRVYVVVLTENSISSDDVRREIDLARAKNKPILPVFSEPRPQTINREMEYQLVGIQTVEYEELFGFQAERLFANLTRTPETRMMPVVGTAPPAVLQHAQGSRIPLRADRQVVGRGPKADIDLSAWDHNQFVSQRHAELQYRDQAWHLFAFEHAKNLTRVNDAAVAKGSWVRISDGDRLLFADVAFRFAETR